MRIFPLNLRSLVISLAIVCALATPALAEATKIDGMYVNTFGDRARQALIFVHGGPGYNSWDFELTTASALASAGFYVVVYDERGQGRSDVVDPGEFNYRQYADDLAKIIQTLGIEKPILLGHSHGGPISIKFDQLYPGLAKKIVLVSAPINFWGSIHGMLDNCARRFHDQGNTQGEQGLAYIYYELFVDPDLNEEQRPGWLAAAFDQALKCGLYTPAQQTSQAAALRKLQRDNPLSGPLSGTSTALPGFLKNENYVHFNGVDHVAINREHFCGIYGDEDGLFTPLELTMIGNALQHPGEPERMKVIAGASHGLYIDQQPAFIQALTQTCGISPQL